MPYSTPSDLYAFGLPRGAAPNPGRHVDGVSDSVFTLGAHGFATGDPVSLRAAGSGALPPEVSAGTTYYAVAVTESLFRISATEGGAPMVLTDTDDTLLVVSPLPIADAIAWADELINDMLPAHAVPIDSTVPQIIRMTSAELAAGKLAAVTGAVSEPLAKTIDGAMKRLERWAKGVPLRGTDVPSPTNLAASATAPYQDRRGWSRYGGL